MDEGWNTDKELLFLRDLGFHSRCLTSRLELLRRYREAVQHRKWVIRVTVPSQYSAITSIYRDTILDAVDRMIRMEEQCER